MITRRRQHNITQFTLGLLVTAAVGCAGNVPDTRMGRAAGEWRFRLPTSTSAVGGLAFGRGGNSTPAAVAPDAPSLIASTEAPTRTRHVVRAHHVAAPAVAAIPAANDEREQPTAAPAAAQEPVQLAQAEPSAEQRYGERQADSRKLEKFKGGDAIVIGAGALVVILLIVLLVLLLR